MVALYAALLLFSTSTLAQDHGPKISQCNADPASPLSYVALPGHPFSTVSTKDGCWLFVSITSSNPKSLSGVVLLKRSAGQITLKKTFAVSGEPSGLVHTHDGKMLIMADDNLVVFMDVDAMTPDGGRLYTTSQTAPQSLGWPIECKPEGVDPATARYPQGAISQSPDGRTLFVANYNSNELEVIDLNRLSPEQPKPVAIQR